MKKMLRCEIVRFVLRAQPCGIGFRRRDQRTGVRQKIRGGLRLLLVVAVDERTRSVLCDETGHRAKNLRELRVDMRELASLTRGWFDAKFSELGYLAERFDLDECCVYVAVRRSQEREINARTALLPLTRDDDPISRDKVGPKLLCC